MTRTIPSFSLCLVLALVGSATGCDSGGGDAHDTAQTAAKPTGDAAVKTSAAVPAKGKSAPAAVAEPAKPKLLGCDQRDFISPGDKQMAEQIGSPAKPKRTCVDYSNRKAGIGSPSCVEGTALETPCPSEKVVATCTLEGSGVVYKYYDGITVTLAEKGCQSLEGTFAKS
jgi:hypothetical protein